MSEQRGSRDTGMRRRETASPTASSSSAAREAIIQKIVNESNAKRKKDSFVRSREKVAVLVTFAFILSVCSALFFWRTGVEYLTASVVRPLHPSHTPSSSRHLLMLTGALTTFEEVQSIPTFQTLTRHLAEVAQRLAVQLPKEMDGVVEDGVGRAEVPALESSSAALFAALQSVLAGVAGPSGRTTVLFAVSDVPTVVFQWVVSTVYVLNQVLPDFYVHTGAYGRLEEDQVNAAHTVSLLKAIALMHHTLALVPLMPSNTSLCRHLRMAPDGMRQFCTRSMDSPAVMKQRMAANYEELIALLPRYGPFRLHYAALYLELLEFPELMARLDVARDLVQRERERQDTYFFTDTYHLALLDWMEAFLLRSPRITTPPQSSDVGNATNAEPPISVTSHLLDVLQNLPHCRTLVQPSPSATWPGLPFREKIERPNLFEPYQIAQALERAKDYLPEDVRQRYRRC